MSHAEDPSVLLAVHDAVATVTLNRPTARNALTAQMIRALRQTMSAAEADDSVRAVVLTGAGSAFCAGLDLKEAARTGENYRETAPGAAPGRPWEPLTKPVIGAINGPTYTGGLEVALHCDLLIASTSATFADTHARVGVMPGWGMTALLPAAVGSFAARALSLTGEPITAETARNWGLVYETVPPDALLARAHQVAGQIAQCSPRALARLLHIYRATAGLPPQAAVEAEHRLGRNWHLTANPEAPTQKAPDSQPPTPRQ